MKAIRSIAVKDSAATTLKHSGRLVLALVLAVCASGCIIIPIPTPELNSGITRTNIGQNSPQQFALGKTTRGEVVSVLGEPDAISPDELMMGYRSSKIRGIFMVGTVGAASGSPITKDSYLVFKFDARGVLQKMESSAHWMNVVLANSLLSSATATNVNLGIRLQNNADWQTGVDGYDSRGAPATRRVWW